MGRTSTDPAYRSAVGGRLREVFEALDRPLLEIAAALGYADASTLSAARNGRATVDPPRLVLLAQWSRTLGRPVDLHWLLTGEGQPWRTPSAGEESWLTPSRVAAIRTLAQGIPNLPKPKPIPVSASKPKARRPRR